MSNLPIELLEAIRNETQQLRLGTLQKSREELGTRYRDHGRRHTIESAGDRFIESPEQRLAYLVARMPATFAVARRVLEEIKVRIPDINFESLLDLGAGPGTVLWAASEVFPNLSAATLIEQDPEMVQLGQRLASKGKGSLFNRADWQVADLPGVGDLRAHDLIVLSYVLGELPADQQALIVEKSWKAAGKAVVFIEPGTPRGFQGILAAREKLIDMGGQLVAPCPHAAACPMAAAGDWCHFSVRLERTSEHRILKEGHLGYEDEKYSYVVGAKEPLKEGYLYRILRHPQKRSGHVNFTLCTSEGLKQKTISRRDGEAYKRAKKLEWGDILE